MSLNTTVSAEGMRAVIYISPHGNHSHNLQLNRTTRYARSAEMNVVRIYDDSVKLPCPNFAKDQIPCIPRGIRQIIWDQVVGSHYDAILVDDTCVLGKDEKKPGTLLTMLARLRIDLIIVKQERVIYLTESLKDKLDDKDLECILDRCPHCNGLILDRKDEHKCMLWVDDPWAFAFISTSAIFRSALAETESLFGNYQNTTTADHENKKKSYAHYDDETETKS